MPHVAFVVFLLVGARKRKDAEERPSHLERSHGADDQKRADGTCAPREFCVKYKTKRMVFYENVHFQEKFSGDALRG